MRIYFGEVSERDIEQFGTDGLLENRGMHYGYVVEFGSNCGGIEDVMLKDGCGRQVPVAVEHIPALIKTLIECYNIADEIRQADELREFAESEDNTAAVCENGHIHY